jgi:hypothetical protein
MTLLRVAVRLLWRMCLAGRLTAIRRGAGRIAQAILVGSGRRVGRGHGRLSRPRPPWLVVIAPSAATVPTATITAAAAAATPATAAVVIATAAGLSGLRADKAGGNQRSRQQAENAAPRLQVRAIRVLVLRRLIERLSIHHLFPLISVHD